jgi:hypothetical protein
MKKCTGFAMYERNKKAQYILYNVTILTRAGGVIRLNINNTKIFETIHDITNFVLHLMKQNNYTCNYSAVSEIAGVYDILFIDKQNNTMQKELYSTK